MPFNVINPNQVCQNIECGKTCPKHMKYCSLRCRDRAHHLRRRLKALGEAGLRYEKMKQKSLNVPAYPDSSSKTLEIVASDLAVGEFARFEGARDVGKIPEGCKWEVTGDIGTLTKTATTGRESFQEEEPHNRKPNG